MGGFVTHHDLCTLVYFRFTYISSLIQTFIHPSMLHDLQLTTYFHIPSFFLTIKNIYLAFDTLVCM